VVDGANGVYVYGSGGAFPNQTYLAANYWVDVVFAQSGPAGPPQSIVAFSGAPQSTAVGTAFAIALQAKVTDASSNPVANASVTFTAPSGGPTATFGGSNTATAVTNAAGIATSPVPTANGATGTYGVTASVTGLPAATFTLTNTATVTAATIFSPSATPTTFYGGSNPIELGVKFRSDANGMITLDTHRPKHDRVHRHNRRSIYVDETMDGQTGIFQAKRSGEQDLLRAAMPRWKLRSAGITCGRARHG
jgi:hypothetical protein